MQELGKEAMEADESVLEGRAGEQNGAPLFTPRCRAVETMREYLHISLDTPFCVFALLDLFPNPP